MSRNIVGSRKLGGSTINSKILTSVRSLGATMEPFTSLLEKFKLANTLLLDKLGTKL